jgi:hypothetical protein
VIEARPESDQIASASAAGIGVGDQLGRQLDVLARGQAGIRL